MRILFTSVGRPRIDSANGVELEIYRTTEALAAMGHDVLLACLTASDAWPIPGVDVRVFQPKALSFAMPNDLKEQIRGWKPDVAVISSVYTPFSTRVALWLRRMSIPYVVRPCGGYGVLNEDVHQLRKRVYKSAFELRMLNRAAFVWAGGDETDIGLYGTKAPILATPRGLDTPTAGTGVRSEVEVLRGLDDRFVFGFVGRLDPVHKGLDLAIEAFDRLADEKTALVLVGPIDSEVERKFAPLVSNRTASDRIRFAGPLFRDDRDRFLGSIDAFIHTSRWEGGIPNAVIEAAAMSRPLLITRQADPAEMLFRSQGCVRVNLDSESITQGMRVLVSMNSAELRAMGNRAAEAVRSEFGWGKMAGGLVKGLSDHGVA